MARGSCSSLDFSRAQSLAAWAGDSGRGKAGQERTSGKPAPQRLQLCHADLPRTPGPSMSPWCCQAQPRFPPQPRHLRPPAVPSIGVSPWAPISAASSLLLPLSPSTPGLVLWLSPERTHSHFCLSLKEEHLLSSSGQPSQTPHPHQETSPALPHDFTPALTHAVLMNRISWNKHQTPRMVPTAPSTGPDTWVNP